QNKVNQTDGIWLSRHRLLLLKDKSGFPRKAAMNLKKAPDCSGAFLWVKTNPNENLLAVESRCVSTFALAAAVTIVAVYFEVNLRMLK
ncbi:hypothetical protein KW478_13725, partial [Vibrio fluvialis]|nr:hypothetical protein [Vibrio fluvialis]